MCSFIIKYDPIDRRSIGFSHQCLCVCLRSNAIFNLTQMKNVLDVVVLVLFKYFNTLLCIAFANKSMFKTTLQYARSQVQQKDHLNWQRARDVCVSTLRAIIVVVGGCGAVQCLLSCTSTRAEIRQ